MTSKTHQFKNAMRVHAPKLIYSTGVSNFQTFKLLFCMYNKLRLHAEILSQRVFDVILSSIQPSEVQSVSFEREQWRTVKSKPFSSFTVIKQNSKRVKLEVGLYPGGLKPDAFFFLRQFVVLQNSHHYPFNPQLFFICFDLKLVHSRLLSAQRCF